MREAKDHPNFSEILQYGHTVEADIAMFMNGEFWQYYKRGDFSTKNYWYCLPVRNGQALGWRNGYVACMNQLKDFYINMGKKVELIEIRNKEKTS